MEQPKELALAKSLAGSDVVDLTVQRHTLMVNPHKEVIIPYTVDEVVATKSQTSSLDQDLRAIDAHMNGVVDGTVLVGHAAKADKLTNPRKIKLSSGASGEVAFDGTVDVTIPVVISDNSHKHTIGNVTGLQGALDKKLDATHDHPIWNGFKTFVIGDNRVEATSQEDTFEFKAGQNITIGIDEDNDKSLVINAIMKDVTAQVANTLKGIKIQYDADRPANEEYIPVVSYSSALEIGRQIDFHLGSSTKDFDGRLLINPAGVLHYTSDGTNIHRIFHEGNDGHQSGIDADLLDGKHATSFSLSDHHHDERYLTVNNGVMKDNLTLPNGKFLRGQKTDNSNHQLIGVSGGNEIDLGTTTLPLTIWASSTPRVGSGSSRHAIYHEGNKPSWSSGVTGIPSTFPPSSHQHPGSDISDATSEATSNTVMKRDSQGSVSVSSLYSTGVRVGGSTGSRVEFSTTGINFRGDVRNVIEAEGNGHLDFKTKGSIGGQYSLQLSSDGTASFSGATSVAGLLTASSAKVNGTFHSAGAATFSAGATVTGDSEFKNNVTVRGALTIDGLDMGNYLKLNTGADGTGFDNKNNANVDTWFGFSISNLCSGQTIAVGKPAFSVNARNGNTYAAGNFYANKTQRVYHEGNFHFSTSDSPSGGVNGDLWFTYEA